MIIIKINTDNEIGNIYKSKSSGDFKLIEKLPKKNVGDQRRYKIKFLATGYESEAYLGNIRKGAVMDATIKNAHGKYRIGQIITSDDGRQVKILDIEKTPRKYDIKQNRTMLHIEVLETGFKTVCAPDHLIKRGKFSLKDCYSPTVQGVGALGDIGYILKTCGGKIRDCKEYRLWEGIMSRCYQKDYLTQNRGYEFAEVSDRWKRFDYFYEDVQTVKGYDLWKEYHRLNPTLKNIYEFDKDTIVPGNKIYRLKTVRFIHKKFNAGFTTCASAETKKEILRELEEMKIEY